jgi:hypothetical protein
MEHKGCTRAFFTAECQQCHPVAVGPLNDRQRHLSYNSPQNSGFLITFLQLIPILNKCKIEINTVVCVANISRLGARSWRDRPLNSSLPMILWNPWVGRSIHACPPRVSVIGDTRAESLAGVLAQCPPLAHLNLGDNDDIETFGEVRLRDSWRGQTSSLFL